MTHSTLEDGRRISMLHVLYVAKMKIRKDVRDGIECRVNELGLFEKYRSFVFRDVPRDKTVEVSVSQIMLEHLGYDKGADIILRRARQKFEEQGISIPLNEQIAMDETTPLKILKEVCTRLEDTNIIVQIDNNALDGIVFEFHDLGEDVYVNVSVSEDQIDSAPESVVAAMIVRRMRLSFESSGIHVPKLNEDDKPVVYKVGYVPDLTKPNIPGFGDWGQ